MELKDTIELMTSSDYTQRFEAEYYQLKIRTEKLETFLEKMRRGELNFAPSCSYEILLYQYTDMRNYLSVLEQRAEIENIDLLR